MFATKKITAAALGALLLSAQAGLAQAPGGAPWWSEQASVTSTIGHNGQTIAGPPQAAACSPFEDSNGPLLKGDPLLDDRPCSPPGWFGAVELGLVAPSINKGVTGPVTVGGVANFVQVPNANLDWTVAPRFEVGYRFAQGAGELIFSYRFLDSSGNETFANFGTPGNTGFVHSRLDMETWDLDYSNHENGLLPWFDLKMWIGVRAGTTFFDSNETSAALDQSTSNYFWGVGPHFGAQVQHEFEDSGLGFFTRVENAWLIGDVKQGYSEVFPAAPGGAIGGAAIGQAPQIVPTLAVHVGLQYSPPTFHQLCLSAGYVFERWWNVADINASLGDVTDQGVFFRAELRY